MLAEDIARIGGSLQAVLLRRSWRYCPHVGVSETQAGYHRRLNSLQGTLGTYFVGPLFAFETSDHCAQFAEWLVERHF
jgi:hypothetical protein